MLQRVATCWSCWSCSRNFATVLIVLGMPWNVGGGMIFDSPGYLAFCHFNFYSWTCREMDAPLAALEGSVNNLQQAHVGRTVRLWTRVLFILWLTRDISSASPQSWPNIELNYRWTSLKLCAILCRFLLPHLNHLTQILKRRRNLKLDLECWGWWNVPVVEVSYTIRNEISMQNRLLDNTNQVGSGQPTPARLCQDRYWHPLPSWSSPERAFKILWESL